MLWFETVELIAYYLLLRACFRAGIHRQSPFAESIESYCACHTLRIVRVGGLLPRGWSTVVGWFATTC